jgi:hypothetical protein
MKIIFYAWMTYKEQTCEALEEQDEPLQYIQRFERRLGHTCCKV